ncbi:hypothetical protein BDF20DRAFT_815879 [Mycotypha africana]|uniref:uncharacterized protein n=1 Tax=Mycotypha africana TaxID=64632 RepID=UPI0022FFD433|nr:uncharacterized protein BDF20DRAFT_815879 [Mycotypha africana]KAI8984743.1 hypothetical protein BDF20DRAFT_815879 [Mycotypha africana]
MPQEQPHLALQLPEIISNIMHFLVPYENHLDYEVMFTNQKDKKTYADVYPCLFVNHLWHDCAVRTMWRKVHFDDSMLCYTAMIKFASTLSSTMKPIEDFYANNPTFLSNRTYHNNSSNTLLRYNDQMSRRKTYQNALRTFSVRKIKNPQLNEPLSTIARNATRLEQLDIYICDNLTNETVILFASHAYSRLTYISLAGCHMISDEAILKVAEQCPDLLHLDLRACGLVSDVSLSTVAKNCPRLKHINVGRVRERQRITIKSIRLIAQYTEATVLGLAGCDIDDECMITLAKHRGPGLERVSVNSCYKISNTSVYALLKYCPNLSVFEMKECHRIKNWEAVAEMVQKKVLLTLCDQQNKDCLAWAARNGRQLDVKAPVK